MNSYEVIFIETSALVDYTLKPEYRETIQAILAQYQTKVSSHYVRMELKKGVIQYLVYLHNKTLSCDRWSEVQKAISALSATPQRHRLGTILEALQNFWTEIEHNELPQNISLNEYLRQRSVSFLRLSIRRLWRQLEKITDKQANPMFCFSDIQPPREVNGLLDNKPQKCPQSQYECKIKDFFRNNKQSFENILDHLQNLPEKNIDTETKHRMHSLKEILRLLPYNNRKFSNKEPNVKDCWNCSDAILAVTAPAEAHILHRNPRHYGPICAALGKQSRTY